MTVEGSRFVRLASGDPTVASLCRDIRAARARARKALPGDRVDVIRFEALSTQLERLAMLHLVQQGAEAVLCDPIDRVGTSYLLEPDDAHAPPVEIPAEARPWLAAGDVVVEIRDPFGEGITLHLEPDREIASPAERWEAPDGESGRRAVAIRFQEQMQRAADSEPNAVIGPSGVSNSVLTETLRLYVAQPGPRVDAPVNYRDGSKGQPFPLRCLALTHNIPDMPRVLRLALLSVRHTEMDVEVDGAWFRNTDISRPRPAGETDDLALELSRRQLAVLADGAPTLIYLYQTGLETGVMGFYRALAEHLLDQPASVAVVPMYFRRRVDGTQRTVAGSKQEADFAPGTTWAT